MPKYLSHCKIERLHGQSLFPWFKLDELQNDMALVVASIFKERHVQGVLEGVQRDILKKYMATTSKRSHNCTVHQSLSRFVLKSEENPWASRPAESLLDLVARAATWKSYAKLKYPKPLQIGLETSTWFSQPPASKLKDRITPQANFFQ